MGSPSSSLYLSDAMKVSDEVGRLLPHFSEGERGTHVYTPRKRFGKIRMEIRPDVGIYYEKITSEETTSPE